MSLNRIFLIGNLGADPELRYSQSQLPICKFSLATNERKQDENGEWTDHTEWHNIVAFGKTAETLSKYLQKGRQVFIEGRIQTRKYQDKEGKDKYFTEVVANGFRFIGGSRGEGMEIERTPKSGGESTPTPAPTPTPKGAGVPIGETISFDDDDIPF